jgi:uncharacterized Tic20 family protein
MSVADEIEKLDKLRQSGAITDEEYQTAKSQLLGQGAPVGEVHRPFPVAKAPPMDENTWSLLLHLSQLCGFLIPLAGFVVPIIIWQVKKNESAVIDRHGRIVANWMITVLIAGIVFFGLSILLIGIPLLIILGVLCVVFPIIGGIKASNGEFWTYPMSYRFLPVD